MSFVSNLLEKQGHFLLRNGIYALICIAIFAMFSAVSWLAVAVVALITLRKGWLEGAQASAVGFCFMLFASSLTMPIYDAIVNAVLAFLPCYGAAVVLRLTRSWRTVGAFFVLQGLLGMIFVYCFAPQFIMEQYALVVKIINELGDGYSITHFLSSSDSLKQVIIAHYFAGIQCAGIVLSAVTSLLLARSIQSRLFYPGGYKYEMLNFRASSYGVGLLVIVALGAYQQNLLAIICLPTCVLYYAIAGFSLGFNIFAKDKGFGAMFVLFVPLIVFPFVLLPIYAVLGALDSLFNFRLYLLANSGGEESKG